MTPANYHTHTRFCDGKNSPEEMVREAIRLGCRELGFSGHAYTSFDESYCMSIAGTQHYISVIRQLQKTYAAQIKIHLGIEQDYYSDMPTKEYDYVIGSVHYVRKNGLYLPVDESREVLLSNVQKHYHGDIYGFIEDYYATVGDIYEKTRCQIVGHFDLITKFNGDGKLFDSQHPRYLTAANKALQALRAAPVTLEVNTGGIARGYTTEPYPARDLLAHWLAAGKRVVYASDCHNAEQLLFGYDIYKKHLQTAGK